MEWMLLPLRRYAEFSGRSRRMEYWMFILFQFIVNIALYALLFAIGGAGIMLAAGGNANVGAATMGGGMIIIFALIAIVGFGLIIPSLAVGVRRLHDTNRSGWWIMAPLAGYVLMVVGAVVQSGALAAVGSLVTVILAIVLLVFFFLDGTVGVNRYGPDPKGRADASVFA
jgi:uncharacterized membrane protein YhaH (DUF805 family)